MGYRHPLGYNYNYSSCSIVIQRESAERRDNSIVYSYIIITRVLYAIILFKYDIFKLTDRESKMKVIAKRAQ